MTPLRSRIRSGTGRKFRFVANAPNAPRRLKFRRAVCSAYARSDTFSLSQAFKCCSQKRRRSVRGMVDSFDTYTDARSRI